ncbi:MAG: hypothetical protein KatS3mg111_0379 [Pirellulaceae bacterium]|nr:MAG: hypothetical protein KatS3mg111_0379 [Pirellulaceae bacterium]
MRKHTPKGDGPAIHSPVVEFARIPMHHWWWEIVDGPLVETGFSRGSTGYISRAAAA